MAKKRSKAAKSKTGDLPQRFDVWQVDCRQMAATVRSGDRLVRPWMAVVVTATEQAVLAFELLDAEAGPRDIQAVFTQALEAPAVGEPHRPTTVQVREAKFAEVLEPMAEPAGIDVEIADELDRVDDVISELSGQIPSFEQGLAGLLEVPGVTPDVAASFFDAAATLFEQAPWKRAGERPVRVSSPKFEKGPWYAVMMGQGGMTRGVVLYDDLETLRRIQQGELSEQENAQLTAALAVVFGEPEDMLDADMQAATKHGWRIAGPEAYPVVYRMDPGLAMRPPQAWELELLEGCLRALPEFVRKKTRRLAPLQITVPVPAGELPLELAWEEE